MTQLSSGNAAPDFELPDLVENAVRLSDSLQSGPVVLVFYKSSCPTCQLTLPFIQQIASKRSSDAKVQIWGISQDDKKESSDFARHLGLSFPILIDDYPYPVSSTYGLEYVPGIFIVNTDRKIGLSDRGFSKDALNEIARLGGPMELFAPDDKLPSRRPG